MLVLETEVPHSRGNNNENGMPHEKETSYPTSLFPDTSIMCV